jgi:hypothetical protein
MPGKPNNDGTSLPRADPSGSCRQQDTALSKGDDHGVGAVQRDGGGAGAERLMRCAKR